jgi:hypothetical protein
MEQNKWRNQIIAVGSMGGLLTAAGFFFSWQESIKEKASVTFDVKFWQLTLWSVPVAALLFVVCWLLLAQHTLRHTNRITAGLFLLVGCVVLFYPSIAVSFGLIKIFRITTDYFGQTVLFYSGAFAAGIGLVGLIKPVDKSS